MFRYFILGVTTLLICASMQVQSTRLSSIFGLDRDKNVDDLSSIRGKQLRVLYKALNEYLVSKTKSTDADDNMDLVMESYNKHAPRKSASKSKTLQAEKLFLSLRNLDKNKKTCNSYGRKILEENKSALEQECDQYYDGRDRMYDIYQHYLKSHAQLCSQEYRNSFNEKLEDMKKTNKLKQVSDLVDKRISDYTPNRIMPEVERLFNFIRYHHSHSEYVLGQLMTVLDKTPDYKYLSIQRDSRTGGKYFDRDNFKRVYNENVATPCRYFIGQLGPDVFEPVLFELDHFPRNEGDLEFFMNMARYTVCKAIVGNPEEVMEEAIDIVAGPGLDGLSDFD